MPYTLIKKVLLSRDDRGFVFDSFHFYFSDHDAESGEIIKKSLIHVDLDKTSKTIRVNVDLDSLPINAP